MVTTSRFSLEKQVTGSNNNTWGDELNTVLDNLDSSLGDVLAKSFTSSDVTLSTAENRSPVVICSGTLSGAVNLIVGDLERQIWVYNNTSGAFSLTVKTSAGTGIAVVQGKWVLVYCDATNVELISRAGGALAGLDTVSGSEIDALAVDTAQLAAEAVTLAKMAQMTADGFIGNDSGGAAVPQELSATEATAILNAMVADSGSGGTKGLVPAPGTGDGTSGKEAYLTGAATYIRPIWHPIGEYVLSGESTPYAITGLTDWDMLDIDLLLDFSADGNMTVQVGYGGTPTWITGTSSYTWLMGGVRMNTVDSRDGETSGNYLTDKIRLNDNTPDASSQYPFTCSLKFYNWSSVADYRQCQFHSTYWQATHGNYETNNGGGTVRNSSNALTAIRFDNSGGGTFTGHITIQGRKIG